MKKESKIKRAKLLAIGITTHMGILLAIFLAFLVGTVVLTFLGNH